MSEEHVILQMLLKEKLIRFIVRMNKIAQGFKWIKILAQFFQNKF